MAYRAPSKAETDAINAWLDEQAFCDVVRSQIIEMFDFFAKEEKMPVFDVFQQRAPKMANNSPAKLAANNAGHATGETYLDSLSDEKESSAKGFMSVMLEASSENQSLNAIDWYSLYFGPIDALSPTLRADRLEFLNSPARREKLLGHHIKSGNIKNPHNLDEVACFLKKQAKKTQKSIAQLGNN